MIFVAAILIAGEVATVTSAAAAVVSGADTVRRAANQSRNKSLVSQAYLFVCCSIELTPTLINYITDDVQKFKASHLS